MIRPNFNEIHLNSVHESELSFHTHQSIHTDPHRWIGRIG